MIKLRLVPIVAGFTALVSLTPISSVQAASAARPVPAVNTASVNIIRMPHTVEVVACGQTPTTGWTNPRLSRVVNVVAPADGVYEFTYLITPPPAGSVTGQMVTPHEVKLVWRNYPEKTLKGVKITGANGSVVGMLGIPKVKCTVK